MSSFGLRQILVFLAFVTGVWSMCGPGEIQCTDGTCAPESMEQAGVNACPDNLHDEETVESPCPSSQYTCSGWPPVCIDMEQVGDGVVDCPDAMDEERRLNDPCGGNDECHGNCTCAHFVSLSVCRAGLCACEDGYLQQNNTKCVKLALGDTCSINDDCQMFINNSQCSESRCHCDAGYLQHQVFNECIARKIGDVCKANRDCMEINDSSCLGNRCTCVPGYYDSPDQHACIRRKLLDECINDIDCTAVIGHSVCSGGQCVCDDGRAPTVELTSCRENMLDDACTLDLDCVLVPHGRCNGDACACISGFYMGPTLGLQVDGNGTKYCVQRRLSDKCDVDTDCYDAVRRSFCSNGSCDCVTGYLATEDLNNCRSRKVDDPCDMEEDCITSLPHSTCTNNSCSCQTGYQSRSDKVVCVLRKIGDATCVVKADCSEAVTYSECRNNTCVCLSGYITIHNNTACVKRQITSQCEIDTDCTDAVNNSYCDRNTNVCTCVSGRKPVENGTDCQPRVLDDECVVDTDCSDSVVEANCTAGVCQCNTGYRGTEDRLTCVLRELGDECTVHTDCSDAVINTYCNYTTNGTTSCQCASGYKLNGNQTGCVLKIITDKCDVNVDCQSAVGNSKCVGNKCRCTGGFQVNKAKTECVRRRIFDRTCRTVADCSLAVANSYCFSRRCVCNSGFYPTNNNQTCTRFKIGDKHCKRANLDCTMAVDMSTCYKGECVCTNGYIAVNNGTICKRRIIGDSCSAKLDCIFVPHSYCTNTTCQCSAKDEPIPNNTMCVYRPTRLKQECTFAEQCTRLDNLSICEQQTRYNSSMKLCECSGNHLVRTDTYSCYEPVLMGDYCEAHLWCKKFGNNTWCLKNRCTCASGFIENASHTGCVHIPRAVGDYCGEDSHCSTITHTTCHVNSTCQCHYKYKPTDKGTTCTKRPRRIVPSFPNVEIGVQCNVHNQRPCNMEQEGARYTRCVQQAGRQHARCDCVPGYASRYNAHSFHCEEVQTYYFNINITLERGCDEHNTFDDELCYMYKPIRVLKQYNNPKTKYFLDIRSRLTLSGLAIMFNDTSARIRNRYVSSEILNISAIDTGMRVGLLVYLAADYFNIVNDTELKDEIIASLIRSDGEIGKSQLKLVWPFEYEIEYKDFDECSEADGQYSDCSSIAWCLNTRASYMCSCKHGYDDWSPDPFNRPGRACNVPREITTDSLSCSNGKCENQWEYISLALVGFVLMLFLFIGYEIYSRKKKLEKSDIYFKLHKQAKREKLVALRERRKTIRRKNKEERKSKKKKKKKRKKGQKKASDDNTLPGTNEQDTSDKDRYIDDECSERDSDMDCDETTDDNSENDDDQSENENDQSDNDGGVQTENDGGHSENADLSRFSTDEKLADTPTAPVVEHDREKLIGDIENESDEEYIMI